MANIEIFTNNEFGSVRTVTIGGEPYIVGKDVAAILGYTNPQKAIRDHVDNEDKGVNEMFTPGGKQEVTVINESGLYSLILHSKLPKAKEFKRWVTSEVLPSIRKHGLYAMDDLIDNPDLAINALTALKAEREKNKSLTETVAVQNQQIAELQPKASYYDVVLNCKDLLSTSEIAKDYGKTVIWLNKYLHNKGVQFKQGGIWLLYQKYAERGLTCTKTHTYLGNNGETHSKPHTYWTQKGRLFIYELMKKHGILPNIEKHNFAE